MSLIMSMAITALVVSPVFVLAGWLKKPAPAYIRKRFNEIG